MIAIEQIITLIESTKNMKVESIVAVLVRVGTSVTKSVKVMDMAMKKKKESSLR